MGDKTTYRDIVYHTIDGISHHTSPTIEELAAAKKNGATPSLAIDTVRYIEFVTPKGNIARLEYPNFFRASGNTVAELRDWLRKEAERQWREILEAEAATSIPQEHLEIAVRYLRARTLPQEAPNWNEYVSDEILTQVLQARRWIHPDVTEKYRELVESMLSYSRKKPISDRAQDVPKTPPALSPEYEIAYLGLSDFVPKSDENNEEINTLQSQYHEGMATLRGINLLDERDAPREPRETQCGPPEGVNIFKWPAAIVCWIKAQLPPKVSAGKCGPNTIG